MRVGADNMAKALNAKTLQYIPTKPDSIPEQLSQIEDVVVKKPSAIVFIAGRLQGDGAGRREDQRRQNPVVNITDRSAGGKFLSFVGADDYSLGSKPRASCSRRWAEKATSSSSRASRGR